MHLESWQAFMAGLATTALPTTLGWGLKRMSERRDRELRLASVVGKLEASVETLGKIVSKLDTHSDEMTDKVEELGRKLDTHIAATVPRVAPTEAIANAGHR